MSQTIYIWLIVTIHNNISYGGYLDSGGTQHQSLVTWGRVTYFIPQAHTETCVNRTWREEKMDRGFGTSEVEWTGMWVLSERKKLTFPQETDSSAHLDKRRKRGFKLTVWSAQPQNVFTFVFENSVARCLVFTPRWYLDNPPAQGGVFVRGRWLAVIICQSEVGSLVR